jgi:hypothetical protein
MTGEVLRTGEARRAWSVAGALEGLDDILSRLSRLGDESIRGDRFGVTWHDVGYCDGSCLAKS